MRRKLDWELQRAKVAAGEQAKSQLVRYLELLAKWNAKYSLTGVSDPLAMVSRHVIDSAAVLPFVHGGRVLDVGTGSGLPGFVIAILRPELRCVLLDSRAKSVRFCVQAVAELGLCNVELVCSRVERYATEGGFDTVIARAVGSLDKL